jgi:uncharacterized protein (TIGR03435 family)
MDGWTRERPVVTSRLSRSLASVVLVYLWTCGPALAQPAFDAASVKPGAPADSIFPRFEIEAGGRLVATNISLYELLLRAHDLRPYQLEGGPSWMQSSKFDITARAAVGAPATRSDVMLMLRSLLAERFALRSRTVTRELPVYALTVARRERLGPRIRPSTLDCSAALAERALTDSSPLEGAAALCQPRSLMKVGAGGATMSWSRKGLRMADLAAMLTVHAGRTVVDRTGLTGTFDFELDFSPEGVKALLPGGGPPVTAAPPADGMSMHSAVQDQLGLKLESSRGPVDILIIDSAAQPTEN